MPKSKYTALEKLDFINEFKLRWMERHEIPKTYQELIKLVESGIEYFNHYDWSVKRNGLTPDGYWNEAV